MALIAAWDLLVENIFKWNNLRLFMLFLLYLKNKKKENVQATEQNRIEPQIATLEEFLYQLSDGFRFLHLLKCIISFLYKPHFHATS